MFEWSILIYNLVNFLATLFLDPVQMVAVNLPVTGLSILVFAWAFYRHYRKPVKDGDKDRYYRPTRRDLGWMAARLVATLLFGMVHLFLALGIACFFLLLALGHLKQRAREEGAGMVKRATMDVLSILAPFVLLAFLPLAGEEIAPFGIIPVIVAAMIHLHWGRNHVKLSVELYFKRYEGNLARRIPTSLQYALCIALITFIALPMTGFYTMQASFITHGYMLMVDLFDPAFLLLVNLPIILVARIILKYTENLRVSGAEKTGTGDNKDAGKEAGTMTEDGRPERTVRLQAIHRKTNNAVIIIAGILFIHVALLLATYSALTTLFLSREKFVGKRLSPAHITMLRVLTIILVPAGFVAAVLVYDYSLPFMLVTGLLSIGCGVLGFMVKGQRLIREPAHQLARAITGKKRLVTLVLQVTVLVYGFGFPLYFITGQLGGIPRAETYYLEMSDGLHLATDVYYANGVGKNPAPVILIRTPYGKGENGIGYAPIYTAQGYHVVVQDFRGTHDSEGGSDFLIFTKDIYDAVDTIDWILKQPWCNGKIGSVGASALCITQYLYAGMNPDGLLSQSFWFGTPDLIEDAILEGAYHKGLVEYWLKGVAEQNWRRQIDIIYEHMTNLSLLDGEAARSVSLDKPPNHYSNVTTRGLHVGGFYDHFLRGTIRGYMNIDDRGAERARGHQKLIIGPWTHVAITGGRQGELTYPASSNGVGLIVDWELEIFDESLRGIPADWSGDRVAYYLMGDVDDPNANANYWKFAPDWPINTSYQVWNLGVDANGNKKISRNGVGLQSNVNLSYLYDPRNPISTRGGNNEPSYTKKGAGPFDQRPVETVNGDNKTLRDDLLLFQSDVLEEPITFEGDLKATLYISSNCTDTDFMVKLCDVYPDGRRMLIIDSALTTRYRVNKTSENFLVPGEEYAIDVDLVATAYQFNKGHRIAVTIQSSNYDRYIINPNTGGPITDHWADGFVANNTIITGPGKSCIYFPVRE